MTNKLTKYGFMIIAAVLLVAMAFAGATAGVTPDTTWYYGNESDLEYTLTTVEQLEGLAALVNGDVSGFGGKTIKIGNDIDCGGETLTSIGGSHGSDMLPIRIFRATVEGNNHTISNFTSVGCFGDDTYGVGLIGVYDGTHIGNLTISNFSVCSGVEQKAGVTGHAGRANGPEYINVHVKYGTICGSNKLGGIVGGTNSESFVFVNCSVEYCAIASSGDNTGGILGRNGGAASKFDNCSVLNCSISGYGDAGGLAGAANPGSNLYFMHDCIVKNCIISSYYVGGLVGGMSNSEKAIDGCRVENCVIVSDGYVGGMVGYSESSFVDFVPVNWVNTSAIRGNGTNVGEVVGSISGTKKDFSDYSEYGNVTNASTPTWLNNGSTVCPQIIIAKSADSEKQGPEVSNYFNKDQFGEPSVATAKVVTRLTGYGFRGKYDAVGYVYESETGNELINTSVINGIVYATNADVPTVPITTAAAGSTIHLIAVNISGYHFVDWDVTNLKLMEPIAIDASGNFIMPDASVNVGGTFAINETNVTVTNNTAEFHNENTTVIQSATGTVCTVLLENVSQVTNATSVNFTAGITIDEIPDISGNTKEQITVFEINATAVSFPARFNMTITFKDEATATADKGKIHFWHYNTTIMDWDTPDLTIAAMVQTGEKVLYTVETYAFSPFGFGIYTPLPPQYTPSSSSKQSGSTVILQEGQVAPNQQPTAAPTAAPTTVPTDKPVTPTVVPTANPTTTPQTPAPFVGLVLGLGAAAVLLRLRK